MIKRLIALTLVILSPLLYAGTTEFVTPGTGGTISGDTVYTGNLDIDSDGVRLNSDNDGMLIMTGLGNGSDEDLRLNLDDTANTAVLTSTTGVTQLQSNGMGYTFGSGVAVVADSYGTFRDLDTPNQLHFNVPTGSTMEWSVNDTAEMTLSATALNLQNNSLTTTGGGSLTGTWSDLGTVTTVDINGGTVDGVSIGTVSAAGVTGTIISATTYYLGSRFLTSSAMTQQFNNNNTAFSSADNMFEFAGNNQRFTNTSGASTVMSILPTYNQASGTASNTDLLINRTETAVGSGTQLLMDLQVGSISEFSISNTGLVSLGAAGVSLTDDGDGAITFKGLGNGSDEDLTLNLDDTSDVGTFTSSTALATLNFSSIALQESGNGVTNVTDCISVLSTEHNPTEAGATNDYVSLNLSGVGGSVFSSTEGDNDQFMAPTAMVARTLRAEVDVAPGVGNDAWIITLRDDAGSTALTCTIDETATNCSDAVNTPAIVAGSKLNLLIDSSGAGADPSAAAVMNVAFCLGQ